MIKYRFKLGSSGRAIGANFGWLVADKMMRLIIGLLVSAWVARYLGPENFGVFAYALTFIAIFQAIAQLGLDNLIVRDISADPSQAHLYLGTALRLRIISAILIYIVMILFAVAFHFDDKYTILLIAIAGLSLFFQVSDVVDLWYQSQLKSKRTVLAKAITYCVVASIKILLIINGAELIEFAAVTAFEAALALVAMYFSYNFFRTPDHWIWSNHIAVKLIRQSWPLLLSGLSILLYMRVGVFFLKESSGSTGVGLYTVGASLSEIWYFVPMALASSIAPLVSRKRVEDTEGYQRLILKLFSAMWLFSVTIVLFNVLTAKYWVALIYGEQYRDSSEIFALHTLTFIPVCLGVMQSIWLINEGRSKLTLFQAISGAICALFLNIFLTPEFGPHGAAASTVISQFVQAFLINALLAKDLFRLQFRSLNFRQILL
jgi:O-antigen/teichoic acid export membrane protein